MKKRWIALLLAAVLPIGVLAGCGSEDMPELSLDSITAPVAAHNEMEVRTALGNYTGISEAAPDSADGEMATVQFAGDASATTALHDGYIYVLSNSELRILRAAGASTTQLNTLDISSGQSTEDSYEFANALLVEGDRLAVVTTASSMDSDLSGSEVCHLRLYDISEPSTPTLLRTFSQDGLYEGIGTANGLLFLVSSGTADLDEASGSAASMPQIGDNAESEAVPAAQFYLSSALDAPTFSIVSAISLADAQRSGVRAFTGTIDHVCVSEQGVFLARSIRMESHGDAYKKDHYSVTNHAINAATELLRLTADADLTMLASKPLAGEVAAWELNAQANALYVVRSLSSSQYQLFEDKTYGWTNRLDQSQNGGTALNVLDLSLQADRRRQRSAAGCLAQRGALQRQLLPARNVRCGHTACGHRPLQPDEARLGGGLRPERTVQCAAPGRRHADGSERRERRERYEPCHLHHGDGRRERLGHGPCEGAGDLCGRRGLRRRVAGCRVGARVL